MARFLAAVATAVIFGGAVVGAMYVQLLVVQWEQRRNAAKQATRNTGP